MSFVECHNDAALPLLQHGTRNNFSEVGAEVWSLVNSELEDSYMDVCGFNWSAEAVQTIPLNYTRQVTIVMHSQSMRNIWLCLHSVFI